MDAFITALGNNSAIFTLGPMLMKFMLMKFMLMMMIRKIISHNLSIKKYQLFIQPSNHCNILLFVNSFIYLSICLLKHKPNTHPTIEPKVSASTYQVVE